MNSLGAVGSSTVSGGRSSNVAQSAITESTAISLELNRETNGLPRIVRPLDCMFRMLGGGCWVGV